MNVLRSSITPVVSPSLVWTDMEKRAFLSTRMMESLRERENLTRGNNPDRSCW